MRWLDAVYVLHELLVWDSSSIIRILLLGPVHALHITEAMALCDRHSQHASTAAGIGTGSHHQHSMVWCIAEEHCGGVDGLHHVTGLDCRDPLSISTTPLLTLCSLFITLIHQLLLLLLLL